MSVAQVSTRASHLVAWLPIEDAMLRLDIGRRAYYRLVKAGELRIARDPLKANQFLARLEDVERLERWREANPLKGA